MEEPYPPQETATFVKLISSAFKIKKNMFFAFQIKENQFYQFLVIFEELC